jgi:CheY-like chemotaxis protein
MGETTFMRVLIVEDEALVAMLLEDMLADAGHALAFTAGALAEALGYIGGHADDFDFAIIDVNLGGQASFPIAEALAAAGKPFAFSTGYGPGSLPPAWRDRPVLSKPFSGADVARLLQV